MAYRYRCCPFHRTDSEADLKIFSLHPTWTPPWSAQKIPCNNRARHFIDILRRQHIIGIIHGILHPDLINLASVTQTHDRFGLITCRIQCGKKHPRKNGNDSNHHKDNLSNILICSILAMTRRKAEGELSDESVDLCTSEQREG